MATVHNIFILSFYLILSILDFRSTRLELRSNVSWPAGDSNPHTCTLYIVTRNILFTSPTLYLLSCIGWLTQSLIGETIKSHSELMSLSNSQTHTNRCSKKTKSVLQNVGKYRPCHTYRGIFLPRDAR